MPNLSPDHGASSVPSQTALHCLSLPEPVSVGIGGPLSALLAAMTGYHKRVSFWVLFPLWGMLAFVLVLLCPVLLPIFLLYMMQRRVRRMPVVANATPDPKDESTAAETTETSTSSADMTASSAEDVSVATEPKVVDDKDFGGGQEHLVSPEVIYDETKARDQELSAQACMDSFLRQLNLTQSIKSHIGLLLGVLLGYYLVWGAVYFWSSTAAYRAMQAYMEAARQNQVLQIATPEQLAYANHMTAIFTIAGVVLVLSLVVSFALTFLGILQYRRIAWQLVLLIGKNLPGLAMLTALFYAIILIMERYYAHLRIIAVEAMIRGTEYFDPSVPFIVLRLYVGAVLLMALALTVGMSLHVIPQNFRGNFTKKQGIPRYEPPPKGPLV